MLGLITGIMISLILVSFVVLCLGYVLIPIITETIEVVRRKPRTFASFGSIIFLLMIGCLLLWGIRSICGTGVSLILLAASGFGYLWVHILNSKKKRLRALKQKPRILIADDESSVLQILSEILEGQGYRVDTASDGTEAWEIFKAQKNDIAIIDMKMLGLDGFTLADRIKKLNFDTETIIITGYPSEDTKTKALKQGVADYISKPFKADDILQSVSTVLERQNSISQKKLIPTPA